MEKYEYKTDCLTLAAVILAVIPGSEATVIASDCSRKTFKISYLSHQKAALLLLVEEYGNHTARVNVSTFCKKLNLLRDLLKWRAAL